MQKKMDTLEAALAQKSKDLESQKKVVTAQKKVNNSLRKEVQNKGGDKRDLFNNGSEGAVGMAGLGLGGAKKGKASQGQNLSNWGETDSNSSVATGQNLANWGAPVGNNATMALMQSAKSWSLPANTSADEVSRVKTAEEIANEIEATREAQKILAAREAEAKLKGDQSQTRGWAHRNQCVQGDHRRENAIV